MAAASTGQLVLEGAELLTVGFQAEGAGKRGHRIFDIDYRGAGADGLGGEVDEHEPWLLAVGQTQSAEFSGVRVDGGARLNA